MLGVALEPALPLVGLPEVPLAEPLVPLVPVELAPLPLLLPLEPVAVAPPLVPLGPPVALPAEPGNIEPSNDQSLLPDIGSDPSEPQLSTMPERALSPIVNAQDLRFMFAVSLFFAGATLNVPRTW